MYIGGAFVRSESGHTLTTGAEAGGAAATGAQSQEVICRGSRKDVRDAVKAALGAQPSWRGKSAYLRGQILYRLAEVMESRREELEERLLRGGAEAKAATREVDTAIDRVVTFAGWSDKYQSLLASSNPVVGPHFGFSVPEPVGVVGIVAPSRPSLLGLVGAVCPVVVSGNTAVVLVSEADPITALTLAECFATSDFPGGVVNLLTGLGAELIEPLVRHKGVRALDLWGVEDERARQLEAFAADSVKRVTRRIYEEIDWYDAAASGLGFIEPFLETKTVWHPMGV
ncbi:MAG: aldehyde dehydrogenase family protein [Polyangiaceae bacterium]|nr:aldehyde dehydrogenase family protein [Polyangiaceae bacterium]MCW5791559.1 aldehyde dehydrogenase family protein [Polyangiaceae bacterium]